LNESSDGEYTNDVHEIIRKCKKTSAPNAQPTLQRIRTPTAFNKIPALQRAASAPVGVVKETPASPRPHSLLREKITTPSASFDASIVKETPAAATPTSGKPQERRSVSTPSIGTDLILNYSTGIESMLGKKVQKRKKKSKEGPIKLVPENERIFKDLTFYYIPPDDIAPLRKFRITKAREFGAIWAKKDWNPDIITHVVVDKGLTYEDIMNYIQQFKLDALPSYIILVNEDYPIDCTRHKFLLDPKQPRYEVECQNRPAIKEFPPPIASRSSDHSLEIKSSKSRTKNGPLPPNETPPKSQRSTQLTPSRDNPHQLSLDTVESWLGKAGPSVVDSPLEESDTDGPNKRRQLFSFGDELDELIEVARRVKHLPLNDEEDDEDSSRPSSRGDPEQTDSEGERPQSRSKPKPKKKETYSESFNQENFSCMTGGTGVTLDSNPNGHTIEILQQMADYYIRTRDHWRQTAYRKAISTLKRQTIKISTYDQAIVLPTIGDRLAKKIEEIVVTGRLRRLENAQAEPTDKFLQIFLKIYGVGITQAGKWVQQGHKTLDDLLKNVHLTQNQRLGIEKYDDFLVRIPREEVTALGAILKNAAAEIDPKVQIIIGGSYRRGATTSGDIDCLLSKPGTKDSRDLLPFVNELVSILTSTGFLVAALATPSEVGSASKWHGCCVLPGSSPNPIWRRIDLLMVPETELGAALIYFTGDDIFNRSMRLLSSKKHWRLNQRGLYKDVMRGPGRAKLNEGTLMEGANEKKIFEILGVPWRPPEQRICH
jgi:DNA polymerase IV